MTISINQQVDYLWKKLGYKVAKTGVSSVKDATNESIISAPFIPGDKVWIQSDLVPGNLPALSSDIVAVYSDAQSSTIKCDMDITATTNRTWLTNLTDWVPTEFGATYIVKVYLAPSNSTTPQTNGVQLYATGSGNNDEWFFDYEAGVLHFIGDNLPSHTFTGKSIFVCGARYIGHKGFSVLSAGTFGNLTLSGYTIGSSGNIYLAPNGNIYVSGATIGNVGYPTLPTDVATVQYVADHTSSLHPNVIWNNDSSVTVSDTAGTGQITMVVDGVQVASMTLSDITLANLTINGETISSTGNIVIAPAVSAVTKVVSSSALQIPVGDTTARPAMPETGYLRFNTTNSTVEVYNGSDWVSAQAIVSSQLLVGDGTTVSFSLDRVVDSHNVLVMFNGVVQVPNIAYITVGNIITFAEAPLSTDQVEIRFIATSVSTLSTNSSTVIVDGAPIVVGTTQTIIDSFPTLLYRSARYMVSLTTIAGHARLYELLVTQNGTSSAIITSPPVSTGGTTLVTYSTSVSAGSCSVLAVSSDPGSLLKIQKTYFAV